MKKNYKNQINKGLEQKESLKEKRNKLYFKWEGYNKSFNRWIDKNNLA